MKTAKQMIDELLTIQEGELKGAQRTATKADIEYLMIEYHGQLEKSELESEIAKEQETSELQILMNDIAEWSDKTFGDGKRNPAIVYHLKKEIDELIKAFENGINTDADMDILRLEFADCMMLLLDSVSHSYLSANDLLTSVRLKLEINKLRKWGKPDENGVVEHIKEQEPKKECKTCEWLKIGYGHCVWCIYNSDKNKSDESCKDNWERNVNALKK